jgi:hypothetical protein
MSRVLAPIIVGLLAIGAFSWWIMPCNASKARWAKAQTEMAELMKVLTAYRDFHGA